MLQTYEKKLEYTIINLYLYQSAFFILFFLWRTLCIWLFSSTVMLGFPQSWWSSAVADWKLDYNQFKCSVWKIIIYIMTLYVSSCLQDDMAVVGQGGGHALCMIRTSLQCWGISWFSCHTAGTGVFKLLICILASIEGPGSWHSITFLFSHLNC